MFIGKIQTHSYAGHMGISPAGTKNPFASKQTTQPQYDQVELGSGAQNHPYSGAYRPNANQMKPLGPISYTQAAPDSSLMREILPPSEQASYTEEDALINQYMKQFRVDIKLDGDGSESSSSEPLKLILKDDIAKEDLEKFRSELAENGLGDEIDWRGVKSDFVQIGINFGNVERFEQKADYLASRYAVLKDRIQTQFTGEKQEAELQKLEQIYTEAKETMANSYADSIGSFFEDLGQSGAAEDMKNSVLALVDQKAEAYTDFLSQTDLYAGVTGPDQLWLKQDDGYMAAQLRKSAAASQAEPQEQPVKEQAPYDGNDLTFAGICAKQLSQQLKEPSWNMSKPDAELGQNLAAQYSELQHAAEKAGVSGKLSKMLTASFRPYMDRLMDSMDSMIDQNREWVSGKPWMSSLIRTKHIDRTSVYQSFQNAVSRG